MNEDSTKGAAFAGALTMVVVLIAAGIIYSLSRADANPAGPVAKSAVASRPAPTTSTTAITAPAPVPTTAAPAPAAPQSPPPTEPRREAVRETRVVEKPVPVPGDDRVVIVEQPPAPGPRSNLVGSSPASGPAGSSIQLTATNSCGHHAAAGTLDLAALDPHGTRIAGHRFATNGSWSATITLPAGAVAGVYRLTATCVEGDIARVLQQNAFTLTMPADPRLGTDRTVVAPGGHLVVSSVDGCVSPNAVQLSLLDGTGNRVATSSAPPDGYGVWRGTLSVHPTTANGSYRVHATCTTPSQTVRYVPRALQVSGPTAVH